MAANTFVIQGTVDNLGKFIQNKRGKDQVSFKLKVPQPGRARAQFHLAQCFDDLANEVALGSNRGDRPLREDDEVILEGWLNSWPDRSGGGKTNYRTSLRVTRLIRIKTAERPNLKEIEATIAPAAILTE